MSKLKGVMTTTSETSKLFTLETVRRDDLSIKNFQRKLTYT